MTEPMNDEAAYELYLKRAAAEYEERCLRCGACCGLLENDPCTELVRAGDGRYECRIYADRFGLRQTVHGHQFLCTSVRLVLGGSWAGSYKCPYKKSRENR